MAIATSAATLPVMIRGASPRNFRDFQYQQCLWDVLGTSMCSLTFLNLSFTRQSFSNIILGTSEGRLWDYLRKRVKYRDLKVPRKSDMITMRDWPIFIIFKKNVLTALFLVKNETVFDFLNSTNSLGNGVLVFP
jgi:hypothetical protein